MNDTGDSRRAGRRNKKRQISSMQFVFVAIVMVGLLLALNLSDRIVKGQRIQIDRRRIEQEIEAAESTNLALEQALSAISDPAFVEAWARREGKMVRPGEVLVVPLPAGEPPAPTPSPTPEPREEPETWTVWWKLFFDEPPPE
jgi:cell division protein FtsB